MEDTSPFVEWVKEGRKYELGAILITQQPGSLAGELLSQSDNWFSFHLLSEGDAGILGKYNSHFSDDILAHLIGEPVPGNCFMWSAPKQPFVLPVRIRSFEKLYGSHVRKGNLESGISCGLSQDIIKSTSEAISRLSDGLKTKLNSAKFYSIKKEGSELFGVYSGQLYYLIKDIKLPTDTTPEEQLKGILLSFILGEGVHKTVHDSGKDYFCATKEQWAKAGVSCRVS